MRRISIRFKLTLFAAIIVISSCVLLNFFVGNVAIFYMDSIGDHNIKSTLNAVKTKNLETLDGLQIDISNNVEHFIQESQNDFLYNSVLITIFITFITGVLTYFIIGYILKPLHDFTNHIKKTKIDDSDNNIAILTDSTEILSLQDSFNIMLKRIESDFQTQKQFSANAAHELRTPLAIMKTKIEVFNKQKHTDIHEYFSLINSLEEQIDKLSAISQILLEMTEIKTIIKKDTVSLAEITEEVVCDLTHLAIQKKISIEQHNGDAIICGNDVLIYRAIYNLIENAIKYNKPSGQIIIDISSKKDMGVFSIFDTGTGIPPADQQYIFEPFFRADKSRNSAVNGVGLGLSLVNEIVKQHLGLIKISESSCLGTEIIMELPLKKSE
ncbi:MAG: HAMP domain-containing histidine kinase [Fusobacterium necrophorum]|nr:HAMP domain-containing histidine kinase [Fusobacterium necrophorum]